MHIRHLSLHGKSPQEWRKPTLLWVGNQVWLSKYPCLRVPAPSRLQSVLAGAAASLEGSSGGERSPSSHMIVERTLFFSGWEEALGSLLAISRNLCQFLPSGSLCWAAADHSQSQRETASEGPRGKQDGRVAIAFAAFFPLELKF